MDAKQRGVRIRRRNAGRGRERIPRITHPNKGC